MIAIRLPRLQKIRSDAIRGALSEIFVNAIAPLHRLEGPNTAVHIDVSQCGWLTPAEIVTLACTIRSLAERNIECKLRLPEDNNSGLMWTLRSFRFTQALGSATGNETWHKYVRFENLRIQAEVPPSYSASQHILPISWIDKSTFGYSEETSNLFVEDPELNLAYIQFLGRMLQQHGFVAKDAIDDFIRGVLREIGWNAVLHSHQGKKWGFAAFGGQVFDDGSSLDFALSDSGCGFSANLLEPYRQARQCGKVPDYVRLYECSETNAAVRFAFDSGSTSRIAYPSEHDVFSDRGLKLVSEILQESGSLVVASSGTIVAIDSTTPKTFAVQEYSKEFRGTCVFGTLSSLMGKSPRSTADRVDVEATNSLEKNDFYPIAILIERCKSRTIDVAARILRLKRNRSKFSLLDFGYRDTSQRLVENGVAVFLEFVETELLTLINVRSNRVSSKRIIQALMERKVFINTVLRLISNDGKTRTLEISTSASDSISLKNVELKSWKETSISKRELCNLNFQASTEFLKYAFPLLGENYGLYTGKIHLLSGNMTDSYFSMIAHISVNNGDWANRWNAAFGQLLNYALENTRIHVVKIIGFSASMRPILDSIDKAHPIRDSTYCLLSYDAPSRAELAEFISAEDEVILCTDVISTASLMKEVISLTRRIGATVISAIALVDARSPLTSTWSNIIEQEIEGVPLLLASSLDRSMVNSNSSNDTHYWVDPVSAVPVPFLLESEIDVERILRTVKLLSDTDAVTIGHFVSGLRHTSVKVDVEKLLTERSLIGTWTETIVRSVLASDDWNDFTPQITLIPVGVNRIDKLARIDSFFRPANEIFAEIITTFFPTTPRKILVPRTFEPGGQVKCSSLEYISAREKLNDVIIVDDGISSGGTIRSLVFQAVKAGARRIMVFALLARTSPEELDQWHITREISDNATSGHALVTLVCPLHLPIPFSGHSDCAQCATLSSLGNRSKNDSFLADGWREIERDLIAPYSYIPSSDTNDYGPIWIFVNSLAEIASRSTTGFESLKNFLDDVLQNQESHRVQREAVIRLFLVEWRLLGRSRLRQVIRRTVKELALAQLASESTDDRRFIEALSLLRAMFPDDYFSAITLFVDRIIRSDQILDRVIFHLATFDYKDRELALNDAIKNLAIHLDNTHLDQNNRRSRQKHLERLVSGTEDYKLNNDIVHTVQGLKNALSGFNVRHDVTGTLKEISKIRVERLDELLQSGYFSSIAKQLEKVALRVLKQDIYPLIDGVSELIGNQIENLGLSDVSQRAYFSDIESDSRAGNFSSDLDLIRAGCLNISAGIQKRSAFKVIINSTDQALRQVLNPDSALVRILDSLTKFTIAEVISILQNSLQGLNCKISVETHDNDIHDKFGDQREINVLTSETDIYQFVALVKNNIQKHVLDKTATPKSINISISSTCYSLGTFAFVNIQISNNGPTFNGNSAPKWRTRQFNKNLELIGGRFIPAQATKKGAGSAASLRLRILQKEKT